MWKTSINRTILECKGYINMHLTTIESVLIEPYWNVKLYRFINNCINSRSINRTILECKGSFIAQAQTVLLVLIEPYWNVKMTKFQFLGKIDISINRTILECKVSVCNKLHMDSYRINRTILECKGLSEALTNSVSLSY